MSFKIFIWFVSIEHWLGCCVGTCSRCHPNVFGIDPDRLAGFKYGQLYSLVLAGFEYGQVDSLVPAGFEYGQLDSLVPAPRRAAHEIRPIRINVF